MSSWIERRRFSESVTGSSSLNKNFFFSVPQTSVWSVPHTSGTATVLSDTQGGQDEDEAQEGTTTQRGIPKVKSCRLLFHAKVPLNNLPYWEKALAAATATTNSLPYKTFPHTKPAPDPYKAHNLWLNYVYFLGCFNLFCVFYFFLF